MNDPHTPLATADRRPGRTRLLLTLLALPLLLLAGGCSGESAGTGAAKGGETSAGQASQAVSFSRCMRDNGVPDFPDPDASGRLTIDTIANTAGIDTDSAAFQQALTACRDLQPAGFTGEERNDDQQSDVLAFAQCVRDNGVPDFPDPGPGDAIINTYKIPSANKPGGMERLNAATDKCGDRLGDAGVTP